VRSCLSACRAADTAAKRSSGTSSVIVRAAGSARPAKVRSFAERNAIACSARDRTQRSTFCKQRRVRCHLRKRRLQQPRPALLPRHTCSDASWSRRERLHFYFDGGTRFKGKMPNRPSRRSAQRPATSLARRRVGPAAAP
jgi:hypothetical protein